MSRRIQIVVPDHVHETLAAIAAARESRPSTIAAGIVIAAADTTSQPPTGGRLDDETVHRRTFVNKRAAPPASSHTPDATPPPHEEDPAPVPDRAAWLEHDRGPEWRATMWRAVERLIISYPVLHDAVRHDWATDRLARDGLLALTVWRQQIDEHAPNDPRLELQWLGALRDFARHHDEHRRQLTRRVDRPERPHGW